MIHRFPNSEWWDSVSCLCCWDVGWDREACPSLTLSWKDLLWDKSSFAFLGNESVLSTFTFLFSCSVQSCSMAKVASSQNEVRVFSFLSGFILYFFLLIFLMNVLNFPARTQCLNCQCNILESAVRHWQFVSVQYLPRGLLAVPGVSRAMACCGNRPEHQERLLW